MPPHLDDTDFVFVDSDSVVAMEDTTIAELIESISEEAAIDSASDTDCNNCSCTTQPVTLIASAVGIAVVGSVAYVSRKFGALPEVQFAVGRY